MTTQTTGLHDNDNDNDNNVTEIKINEVCLQLNGPASTLSVKITVNHVQTE